MMGSGESTTRKVSFGVDDEHDTVRILRGVKVWIRPSQAEPLIRTKWASD